MARLRVHELAKELGITSKELLAYLKEKGEFVKSASSMVEAPIVRQVRESLGGSTPDASAGNKAATSKPAAKKTSEKTESKESSEIKESTSDKPETASGQSDKNEVAEAPVPKPAAKAAPKKASKTSAPLPGPRAPKPKSQGSEKSEESKNTAEVSKADSSSENVNKTDKDKSIKVPTAETVTEPESAKKSQADKTAADTPAAKQADKAKKAPSDKETVKTDKPSSGATPGPRPGPRPGGPRPGNNPYASSQGMPRPGGSGGPRPGPRPGPKPGGSSGPGNNSGGGRSGASGKGGQGRGGNRSQGQNNGGNREQRGPRPSSGPRPNPAMMPGSASFTRPDAPRGGAGNGGGRGGRGRGTGGGAARPGGAPAGQPGGFAGGGAPRGGRGGGRGSTPGAFGRGNGRSQKGRKSKRAKRQEFEEQSAPAIGGVSVPRGNGAEVRIRQGASLADFAEKIEVNPAALVTVLFHLGEMATATQSLDQDTFEALGAELGYQVVVVSPEDEDRELLETFDIDLEAEELADAEHLMPRPPVVTVMGHVDHGKTKLLDAIRKTDVVDSEHGGITQHIGAYQVKVNQSGKDERPITFIDTPGHEAFTAMRARGAQVTDIAILVVAADDGVMPQTVEAINHAQAANVPIVVAVNKVDKPEANPDKIRGQLTEYGLVAEDYGGEVMFVDVSAKEEKGIKELLEAVLLTADAALDLGANPDTEARGVAIEANLDKGRGAVTTMLIERGTLRVGDSVVVGPSYGRVRAMFDEKGNTLDEAGPSRPVQMLGLTSVPRAGDSFLVASDDRTARQIADKREAAERQAQLARRRKRVTLEDFDRVLKEGKVDNLNLIIKGDVSGAVEALEDSLLKLDVGEEVALRIIHRGVGAITQNDVNLATVDNAVIIAFNVRPAERVAELADSEGVEIKYYTVIYQALEEIESAMKGMLKPIYEEAELGSAEIRQVFRSGKFGNIAGSIIRKGTIRRGSKARLVRDGIVVADDLEIQSLRREKEDVVEVREGYECGITLGYKDISEGDIIETWEMREKPRE